MLKSKPQTREISHLGASEIINQEKEIRVVVEFDDSPVNFFNTQIKVSPNKTVYAEWAFVREKRTFSILQKVMEFELAGSNLIIVAGSHVKIPRDAMVPVVNILEPSWKPTFKALGHVYNQSLCLHSTPGFDSDRIQFTGWMYMHACPVPDLVIAVVCQQNWSNTVVILENTTKLDASLFIATLNKANIFTSPYNIDDYKTDDGIQRMINDTYTNNLKAGPNYIVICKVRCVNTILRHAEWLTLSERRRNEFGQFSKWLFIHFESDGTIQWNIKASQLTNVAFITIPEHCSEEFLLSQQFITKVIENALTANTTESFSDMWTTAEILKQQVATRLIIDRSSRSQYVYRP
ncbi:hypothetical protein ScPMuIL_007579 [Solemya velum]